MSKPSITTEPMTGKAPITPMSEGNPALRMMGLPRLRARLPSRNWTIFLTIVGSFTTAILYDRHHKKSNQQKWCNAVSNLSNEIIPINRLPRKLTVFLAAPPGDGLQPAREYFTEYVKPVLVAAAVDWEVIEGRREGDLRAKLAEKIREIRRSKEQPPTQEEDETDMVKVIRKKFGTVEEDARGGDLVIGRHTWREYVRGLHEGWLGPLDEPLIQDSSHLDAEVRNPGGNTESAIRDDTKTVFDSTISESTDELTLTSESESQPGLTTQGEEAPKESPAESKGEESKPKVKATTKPPYILPDAYTSASLSQSIPSSFPPSSALPLPHLLGFLNTPIRIYRFLNKRHLADTAGHQVASFILSPTIRPYEHPLQAISSSDTPSSDNSSPFTAEESDPSRGSSWEQQILLSSEESDWHKVARKPNPDTGSDQHKERPWLEPMVIDSRVGERMRTVDPVPDPALSNESSLATDVPAGGFGLATPSLGLPDDGRIVKGNSREWKGGADRAEKLGWEAWAKSLVGWEEDKSKCKGWEQGLVGDESS